MEAIRLLGIAAFAGLAITAIPMVLALAYAVRPNERWLGLMRPLTLSAIFATIANTFLGLANMFRGMARVSTPEPPYFFASMAETSVVPFVSFVFLATAWLCVAIGMRRRT